MVPIISLLIILLGHLGYVYAATYGTDNVTAITAVDATVCAAGCDFTTLGAALTGTGAGDVIGVKAGTYANGLTVITNRTVVGFDDENPTFTGCFELNGVVTLRDFTITNNTSNGCGDSRPSTVAVISGSTGPTLIEYLDVRTHATNSSFALWVGPNAKDVIIRGNDIFKQGGPGSTLDIRSFNGLDVDSNRWDCRQSDGDCIHNLHGVNGGPNPSYYRNNLFARCDDENCVDIKSLGSFGTLNVERNYFPLGASNGGDRPVIVSGQTPGVNPEINFRQNFFDRTDNDSGLIRFLFRANFPGNTSAGSGAIAYNVFVCNGLEAIDMQVSGSDIHNNTFIDCDFSFGGGGAADGNGTLRNNIFETVSWADAGSPGWTCSHNNVRNATGTSVACTDGTAVNPTFVDAPSGDYNIQNVALIESGFAGFSIGAMQPPVLTNCLTVDANTWQCSVNAPHTPVAVNVANITPKEDGNTCTASNGIVTGGSTFTFDVSGAGDCAALDSADVLTVDFAAAAVTDAISIGGPEFDVSSTSLAQNGFAVTNNLGGAPSSLRVQTAYRCRRVEVAGETFAVNSTLLNGLQDAVCEIVAAGLVQVRIQVECRDDDCPSIAYVFHARDNGAGDWYILADSFGSQLARLGTDSTLNSLDPTTRQLETCTFQSGGVYHERGTSDFPSVALEVDECTEFVAIVEISSSAVEDVSFVEIRLEEDSGTDLDTYEQTARINVVRPQGSR